MLDFLGSQVAVFDQPRPTQGPTKSVSPNCKIEKFKLDMSEFLGTQLAFLRPNLVHRSIRQKVVSPNFKFEKFNLDVLDLFGSQLAVFDQPRPTHGPTKSVSPNCKIEKFKLDMSEFLGSQLALVDQPRPTRGLTKSCFSQLQV